MNNPVHGWIMSRRAYIRVLPEAPKLAACLTSLCLHQQAVLQRPSRRSLALCRSGRRLPLALPPLTPHLYLMVMVSK